MLVRCNKLRNAIECAFEVMKKRLPILGSGTEPHYPIETQKEIVHACVFLHNYLLGVDLDERLLAEVDKKS